MSTQAHAPSSPPLANTLFDRALRAVAAVFVVAQLGTVTAGVVFRAANHPLSWTDEAAGFLMVWMACLGWMIATRNQTHIRIRYFQDKLPPAPWRGTELLLQLAMAVLGGFIAWYSVHLIQVNSDIEATSMPIVVAWMYVPMLPAGLVTMVQALIEVRQRLASTARPVQAAAVGVAEGGAS